jgi:predicted MFS family arabinose efflux permease
MTRSASNYPAVLATQLSFFTAGFAMACCAPFIPFIKDNVGASEGEFGLLLLFLGLGSVISMPAAGIVSAKKGARSVILLGGFGLVVFMPLLLLAKNLVALGAILFVFGASLGAMDVSMNVHAVEVERREQKPLMSKFHAQFSIGALAGAALITLLLSIGVGLIIAALIGSLVSLVAMLIVRPHLFKASSSEPPPLVLPRGIVLLLGFLAAIAFLVEGAVLDWGALLIIERQLSLPHHAGIGYILFSIAMVIARLCGGRLMTNFGDYRVLTVSSLITMIGIGVVLLTSPPWLALTGFILIGLGAANIVPVLFSAAGRQTVMPASLAIAAVTTTGYAGVLVGPALVGFAADLTSLPIAFGWLTLLIGLVALSANKVVKA